MVTVVVCRVYTVATEMGVLVEVRGSRLGAGEKSGDSDSPGMRPSHFASPPPPDTLPVPPSLHALSNLLANVCTPLPPLPYLNDPGKSTALRSTSMSVCVYEAVVAPTEAAVPRAPHFGHFSLALSSFTHVHFDASVTQRA